MTAAVASLDTPIAVRDVDGVTVVTLAPDRAERSRLTPARLEALASVLDRLSARDDVALIVLFGGAREFCLGADLDVLRAASAVEADRYLRLGQAVMAALESAPVPTLAAVGGLALGGGFELALACDMRWAHRRAVFSLPEAGEGLVPAWGAARALSRELTSAAAWELLVGARIGAARALDLGLIGRLFEGRDFNAQVLACAQALAAHGRDTLAGLKTVWRAARTGDEAAQTPGGSVARSTERNVCLERLGGAA